MTANQESDHEQPDDLRQAAAELRRRYYGDDGRPGPPPAMAELAPEIMDLVDQVVYGEIYNRPAVDLQTRSLCTIAALTVLGHSPDMIRRHIQGALNVGVTREQICEIIAQMIFYGGMPAAVNAFRAAKESFDQISGQLSSPATQQAEPPTLRTLDRPAPPVQSRPAAPPRSVSDEDRVHRNRQYGQPHGGQPGQSRPPANRPRPASRGGNQPAGDGRSVGRQSQGGRTGQRGGFHVPARPPGRGGGGPGGKRNPGRGR